jgi:aminotransferase
MTVLGASPSVTPLSQKRKTSIKASQFTESVIREMTRIALQKGAVNLAQGFPDFSCPVELTQAVYDGREH